MRVVTLTDGEATVFEKIYEYALGRSFPFTKDEQKDLRSGYKALTQNRRPRTVAEQALGEREA